MQDHSINHSHRQEQTVVFQQDLLRVVGQFGRCVVEAAAGSIGVNVQMWPSLHPITAVHLSHPSGNPVCSWTWPAPGTSVSPGTFLCQSTPLFFLPMPQFPKLSKVQEICIDLSCGVDTQERKKKHLQDKINRNFHWISFSIAFVGSPDQLLCLELSTPAWNSWFLPLPSLRPDPDPLY